MRRWHEDARITRRHWREHLMLVHGWPKQPADCVCDLQMGRFRKIGGHGCGKARCLLCRFDKIFQVSTHRQRLADLRFREELAATEGR
jgi:hypothetical protein